MLAKEFAKKLFRGQNKMKKQKSSRSQLDELKSAIFVMYCL